MKHQPSEDLRRFYDNPQYEVGEWDGETFVVCADLCLNSLIERIIEAEARLAGLAVTQ